MQNDCICSKKIYIYTVSMYSLTNYVILCEESIRILIQGDITRAESLLMQFKMYVMFLLLLYYFHMNKSYETVFFSSLLFGAAALA